MTAFINTQMQNFNPQLALACCVVCPCFTALHAGLAAIVGSALGAIAMAAAGSIGASTGAVFAAALTPILFIFEGLPAKFITDAVLTGKISLNSAKIRLCLNAIISSVFIVFVMSYLLPSLGYPITLGEVLFLYVPFFLFRLLRIPTRINNIRAALEAQQLADLAPANVVAVEQERLDDIQLNQGAPGGPPIPNLISS